MIAELNSSLENYSHERRVTMRIVAVVHGQKVEGLVGKPPEIAVNPTLTMAGMEKVHELVEEIRPFAPFAACYSSRLARALDTASVLCLAFDLDLQTMKDLGQYANKDGETVVFYPGHEKENYRTWQEEAGKAVKEISKQHAAIDTVLMVSHGPIIGGIIAYTKDIRTEDKATLRKIIDDSDLRNKGFVVFEVNWLGLKVDIKLV